MKTEYPFGSFAWQREQKEKVVALARKLSAGQFVLFDTETTGFNSSDEIISIAIIDQRGAVLLDTLIRPNQAITNSDRHGITDERVAAAPTFPQVYPSIRESLDGKLVLAYNANYDWRMLDASCDRHKLPRIVPLAYECIMELYATWWGDWNDYHESFRWQKLTTACQRFGIDVGQEHRALDDCKSALGVLKAIGEGKSG